MAGIVALTTIVCMPAAAQDRCGLPAYSHNDYENRRPLLDAVGFGYSGVEVDYYLANGRLLVGHDAAGLTRERSLAALYLVPLREMIRSQGPICAPGRQFLLTIETKQRRQAAFDSLMSVLSEYGDLVGPGGPVRVVLVGWTPPADSTLPFDLQYRVHSPDQIETMPTSPGIALVSVRYQDLFRWSGRGEPGAEFQTRTSALVRRAHGQSGRRLRIYDVPYHQAVYRELLEAGVDLLGVKNLEKGRTLLKAVSGER